MEKTSMLRGAGAVLALGILLMLIGTTLPNEWAIERPCREVGVVVTLMGMVAMVAERQSVNGTQQRLLANTQPTSGVREDSRGETTHRATAA